MAEGAGRDQWNHTATNIAHRARVNGDKRAKPEDYHPYSDQHRPKPVPAKNPEAFAAMKELWVDRSPSSSP